MARTRPRKRNAIHFVFSSHQPSDRYLPGKKLDGIKTIVFENSNGFHRPFSVRDLHKIGRDNIRNRSTTKTFSEALRKGIKIVVGEFTKTPGEKAALQAADRKTGLAGKKASAKRNLHSIKEFLRAFAEEASLRHGLIKRTIKEEAKPLIATYGSAHSGLSRELQKEGIESSRTMKPTVFPLFAQTVRRILAGQEPTDLEYKRAFVEIKAFQIVLPFVETERIQAQVTLALNAMIRSIAEKQIDKIVETGNYRELFEFHGLPRNPSLQHFQEVLHDLEAGKIKSPEGKQLPERTFLLRKKAPRNARSIKKR